jgi:hypothetical protein
LAASPAKAVATGGSSTSASPLHVSVVGDATELKEVLRQLAAQPDVVYAEEDSMLRKQ